MSSGKDNKTIENTRSNRRRCWDARDQFFSCLDEIKVMDALDPKKQDEIKSHCSKQLSEFNENCADSWIRYFKEKRFSDYQRAKVMGNIR